MLHRAHTSEIPKRRLRITGTTVLKSDKADNCDDVFAELLSRTRQLAAALPPLEHRKIDKLARPSGKLPCECGWSLQTRVSSFALGRNR